jgi:transposase-like protein
VALSAERLRAWLAADLSRLDLLAVQIDGLHLAEDLLLVLAVGIDGEGRKHPLGLVEGATENAAVVQALLDELVKCGLDPSLPRLFLIDGAKALSKAIRRSFGRDTPIQRCQVHKARNILDRLPRHLQAATRRAMRRPGTSTTPSAQRSCCATSPAPWSARRRVWPGRSWRGSTRSPPLFGSAC